MLSEVYGQRKILFGIEKFHVNKIEVMMLRKNVKTLANRCDRRGKKLISHSSAHRDPGV